MRSTLLIAFLSASGVAGSALDNAAMVQQQVNQRHSSKESWPSGFENFPDVAKKAKAKGLVKAHDTTEVAAGGKLAGMSDEDRTMAATQAFGRFLDAFHLDPMTAMMIKQPVMDGLLHIREADLDSRQRNLLDAVLVGGFKANVFEDPPAGLQEIGTILVDSGYEDFGQPILEAVQILKSAQWHMSIAVILAEGLSDAGLLVRSENGLDLNKVAQVVRNLATLKGLPKILEPAPQDVVAVKELLTNHSEVMMTLATILEEKAKSPKEWISPHELTQRVNITVLPSAEALLEELFVVADMHRSDVKGRAVLHEITVLLKDVGNTLGVNVTGASKELMDGVSEATAGDTDMRAIIPLVARFLNSTDSAKGRVKELVADLADCLKNTGDGTNVQKVLATSAFVLPLAMGLDTLNMTHPRAVVESIVNVWGTVTGEIQNTTEIQIVHSLATAFRNIHGFDLPVIGPIMFPLSFQAIADFMDRQAIFAEAGEDDTKHTLSNVAWLLDDLPENPISQFQDQLPKMLDHALLFICNLQGVRESRKMCASVPVAERAVPVAAVAAP